MTSVCQYPYKVEYDGQALYFDQLRKARNFASVQSEVSHNLTVFLYELLQDTWTGIAYYRNGHETVY